MPKETIRRKVDALCKTKQLAYSVTDGVTVGDNFEVMAKKMAPVDLLSIEKAIRPLKRMVEFLKFLKTLSDQNKKTYYGFFSVCNIVFLR